MAGTPGNAEKHINLTTPTVVSRLPTFKGPRDLTLSSVARSRRQYAPNIPPKRERGESTVAPTQSPKSSPKFAQPSLPGPSELKHKRPRPAVAPGLGIHGRRGGTRGREKPELVQSASIFSEGVGIKSLTSRRTPSTFSSSSRGRGRGRGGGGRPSISTTELEKVLTKGSRKAVTPDDKDFDIDDDDDDDEPIGGLGTFLEGLSQGPLPHHLKPVSLPLDDYFAKLTTKTDELKKKSKKAKPGDSFSQFLSSAPAGALACLQMPYILPFRRKKKDSELSETIGDRSKTFAKNLSDVKGGCIGKLQVRKSGKCSILLGKSKSDQVTLEVEPSKVVGFRQELIAIDIEKKSFTMLGKVQHKFVCAPDPAPLFNRLQFRH